MVSLGVNEKYQSIIYIPRHSFKSVDSTVFACMIDQRTCYSLSLLFWWLREWLLDHSHGNKIIIPWLTEQFGYFEFTFCHMFPPGTLHKYSYLININIYRKTIYSNKHKGHFTSTFDYVWDLHRTEYISTHYYQIWIVSTFQQFFLSLFSNSSSLF